MNGGAVVLAAHGSDCDDRVNARVRTLADQVAATGRFAEVFTAFHRGFPHYSTVLDRCRSSSVTVIPYMTSGGYYCDEVLPRELARNESFGRMRLRLTRPVGSSPGMAGIGANRAIALASDHNLALEESTLLVIGHGTKRHAKSRDATIALAATLQRRLGILESLPCFLDDEPTIEKAHRAARGRGIIAIVFLLSDGVHARRDIVSALSLNLSPGDDPPYVDRNTASHSSGRYVVCDAAIGTDSGMAKLIIDLAVGADNVAVLAREVLA